jgi:tetratricopeptide (TPR) repeat protein
MSVKIALGMASRSERLLVGALSGFLLLSLAQGQTPPGWIEQYQAATQQLQSGNHERATQLFEALGKAYPNDYELDYAIGTALDSNADHREATDWYLKALRLNPQYGPTYNNLALNYVTRQEFAKAVPLLERAVQLDPRNGRAVYNLGLVHLQLKHFRQAAKAFQHAHELNPNERDPLARLAYASFLAGQREEGLKALATLLRLSGERQESALQAVQILDSVGLYHEAVAQAQDARQAGLASPRLSYEEANALCCLGNYRQAADLLLKAGAPEGLALEYDLLLGSSQALAGDLPGAVRKLQGAVHIAPQRPEPYYRLALAFLEGYRDQDAQDVLAAGLQQIPESPLLLYGSGVVQEVPRREAVRTSRKRAAESNRVGPGRE